MTPPATSESYKSMCLTCPQRRDAGSDPLLSICDMAYVERANTGRTGLRTDLVRRAFAIYDDWRRQA